MDYSLISRVVASGYTCSGRPKRKSHGVHLNVSMIAIHVIFLMVIYNVPIPNLDVHISCCSPPGRVINPIYTNSNARPQAENEYQTTFRPVEEGLDTESFCSSVLEGSQTFLTKIDELSDSSSQLEFLY